MIYIGLSISIIYFALIIFLYIGWKKIKVPKKAIRTSEILLVSIIIAARNEENNIIYTLQSIAKQTYRNIELIIINDNSTDATNDICEEFLLQHPNLNGQIIKLDEIENNISPKKRALSHGIEQSHGEIILTTDADCIVGKNWVSSHIMKYVENSDINFISGPVTYKPLNSFFDHIQALEFSSLVVSGAGAIGHNLALMCNGANLSFKKKAFEKVRGYVGNNQYTSGDDVFLMMKIRDTYGKNAISYLKNTEAIVNTKPKNNIQSFFNQRIRWASKSKAYSTFFPIFCAIIVLLMNVQLLFLSITFFIYPSLIDLFLISWLLKIVSDFIILNSFAQFSLQIRSLLSFIPTQIFVMFSTVISGILGIIGKFEWKGRSYNN